MPHGSHEWILLGECFGLAYFAVRGMYVTIYNACCWVLTFKLDQ
jgi:hypothetical protein